MIAQLGTLALRLGLILAVYGVVASVVGWRRRNAMLTESARTVTFSLVALLAAANILLLAGLLGHDFSIRYVAENGSRATPTFFTVLSLWSADEGSLLLWNLVLAGYIAAVAFRFRRRAPATFSPALTTMYATQAFFLVLVLFAAKPFETLAVPPLDGAGPLPLLQNHPLMAAHPPLLYLGFIGFTVPFAFAVAALVTGEVSDGWLRATRRWTIAAWGFLTAGLFLGALWSYGVLGWGGYWAWDPVENVALLPWLTATAFLHSVMVQERRGMLKTWNLALVIATYALTVLGTFLTRGSILTSVHTFAQSLVGPLYLGFLALIIVAGFGLLVWRADRLRSEGSLDAVLSRETAFLGNNLLFVAFTFTVLLGTIFPLVAEAATGTQVSVGGPYFRRTTAPILLLLILLMGVGPLVPWRRVRGTTLRKRLAVPAQLGVAVVAVLFIAGVRNIAALVSFGAAAFVLAGIVGRFIEGARSVMRARGGGVASAVLRLVRSNRRLYGGLVVHAGVVIAAVAITLSSSFATDVEGRLGVGEELRIRGYTLRYLGSHEEQQRQRRVLVADLAILRDGKLVDRLRPSLNFYPRSNQGIGSPAIRVRASGDLYASLTALDAPGQSASFRVFDTPGVLWLWVGGSVMLLGTLLAGWPAKRRTPSPEPAVVASPPVAVGEHA